MNKLHPGAKWKFRINSYGAMIIPLFVIIYVGNILINVASTLNRVPGQPATPTNFSFGGFFMVLGIALIIFIILSEIYVRLAYNAWKYEFGEDSLKLERGVIWKKYSNIPYERVQNVDVHRGILARMMGFSTVDIQTAGLHVAYGRHGGAKSEGHIPAVSIDHAEKIREFLMKKISHKPSPGM